MESNKRSYAKIILLWLNVLFYTVLITLVFAIFKKGEVGITEWIKAFTPASTGQYWFFSAYFILFFLMPFLNQLLHALDAKKQFALVLTLVLCFSVLPTIRQGGDAFVINSGYSPLWLIVLYLLGGCVKKANLLERIQLKWWVTMLGSSLLICIISKFAMEYVTNRLLGEVKGGGILVSYISPLMILIALSLLAIFARIKVDNERLSKIILLVSGSTFSVYIIHEHPLLKHEFLIDSCIPLLQLSPVVMVLSVLGIAALIFIACTLVDMIRVFAFKALKVNKFAQAICKFTGDKLDKVYKRISKEEEEQKEE